MLHATLKSLLAHKLRLALTAIAIVLGVAFMAGTFVLTDTIRHTFDTLFVQASAGKDFVVRSVAPYKTSGRDQFAGSGQRPPVPASLIATVNATPGVRDSVGQVMGLITVVTKGGKAIKNGGAPTFGTDFSTDRSLSSFTIATGRGPRAPNEVLIDVGTAKSQHFAIGDTVHVVTDAGPGAFVVVGTEKFGNSNSLAGATVVSFQTPEAQRLFGKPGYFDQIDGADKSGVDLDSELTAIGARLPPGYEVVTASAAAAQQAKSADQFVSYFHDFLLAFALIALFVGAFLIANTFSILIGQRTRELALLRAVGASRAQVIRSLIAESLITGLVGSIVGVILGVPLAAGLYSLLKNFGLGLPTTTLQLLPRTIYVSLLAGTAITVVSAVGPSVRGSRVPPVAAMRDDVVVAETSTRRRSIVGGVLLGLGVLQLVIGLAGGTVALVGVGAALSFVGVAFLAPLFAGPLAMAIGRPLPRMAGVTGRLGRQNAARNPKRTAGTASALMVGLGLVCAIATLGSSLGASFSTIVDRALKSNYVITAGQLGGSPAALNVVKGVPGVTAVSPFDEVQFHESGSEHTATVVDPVAGPQVFNIQMVKGSSATLAKGDILIDSSTSLISKGRVKVGDTIDIGFSTGGVVPVVIGGTFKTNAFLDSYILPIGVVSANTTQLPVEAIFVKTTTQTTAEQDAIATALTAYPNFTVKTVAQFKSTQKKRFTTFLAVAYVLLALSILIAAFSVVNTLALSVIERYREIGLLRAIGMARTQVRGMIRGEAVIVSLLGAILGVVLGVSLGSMIVEAIGQSGGLGVFRLVIPVTTLIIVLILAGVIGVVAAVFPARRAAHLDILQAVASS